MVISNEQQEWIDKFLRDELNEDDMARFQKELSQDDGFKREFVFQKSLHHASKLDDVQKLISSARIKNSIASKEEDPRFKIVKNSIDTARATNSHRFRKQGQKKWFMIAASFLLIFIVGLNYYTQDNIGHELAALFDNTNYSSQNINGIQEVSARDDVIKNKLDALNKAQLESQYQAALKIIQELRKPQFDYNSNQLLYYEALINAQIPDYDISLAALDRLLKQNTEMEHEARWLRSLIYIKTNDRENAKKEFEILLVNSEKYKTKAQKMLTKYFGS